MCSRDEKATHSFCDRLRSFSGLAWAPALAISTVSLIVSSFSLFFIIENRDDASRPSYSMELSIEGSNIRVMFLSSSKNIGFSLNSTVYLISAKSRKASKVKSWPEIGAFAPNLTANDTFKPPPYEIGDAFALCLSYEDNGGKRHDKEALYEVMKRDDTPAPQLYLPTGKAKAKFDAIFKC